MSDSLWSYGLQHARLPCPSPSPRACSDSCPLSLWFHPTISSSAPLFLLPSVFPSLRVFSSELLFASSSQTILASASASVLPVSTQGFFPLGLTGLISLLSKGLSRVFSNTTIQKHQFFAAKPSLWSNTQHPYMTVEKNHSFAYTDLCQQSDVSAF